MENVTPAPAKRALAALDQASATAPAPTKRISKKIIAAIDAMVSGECKKISEAAEKVGLARESLSRALNKPHVAELMRQKVLRSLAIAASRAGATNNIPAFHVAFCVSPSRQTTGGPPCAGLSRSGRCLSRGR
jgi:DNA-binding phage protein